MRKGFSLLTTIFMILFVASISAMIINLSDKTIQETVIQYKKEQSILYAKSYTELAIMLATSKNCIKTIKGEEGSSKNKYKVFVKITYLGKDINDIAGCEDAYSIGDKIDHISSKGNSILVDVSVKYDNPFIKEKTVQYFRRTIQKL